MKIITYRGKNPAAVALGKLAKGHPKNFSREEIAKRVARLADARKKRWPAKAGRKEK